MKKEGAISRFRKKIKPENKKFVEKNLLISRQVYSILEEKGWSQKDLAKALDKHESEVSKMLSGMHNLTLQSITKLEVVLGKDIIITPNKAEGVINTEMNKLVAELKATPLNSLTFGTSQSEAIKIAKNISLKADMKNEKEYKLVF